jgi:hypothetical protein
MQKNLLTPLFFVLLSIFILGKNLDVNNKELEFGAVEPLGNSLLEIKKLPMPLFPKTEHRLTHL